MQQQLANAGVQVHLSRNNDNALGPCVDQRAEMANSLRPNCVVSIHTDGGPAGGHEFHVNYSAHAAQPGAGRAVGAIRADHARQDGRRGADTGDLHRQQRPVRPGRPAGPHLAQYPLDPGRVRQHEGPQEGAMATMQGWQTYANATSARASPRSSRPAGAQRSASATPVTPGRCASSRWLPSATFTMRIPPERSSLT